MHLVYFKDISSRRLCLAYPYQHLQEPNELFKKTDMTLMSGLQGLGQMELGVLLLMCLNFLNKNTKFVEVSVILYIYLYYNLIHLTNLGRVCEGFIAAYMNAACDRDPTGNIFRMPAGLTKLDLHSLYQTIHKDGIGKSKFYNILDSKYRNLVFCKVHKHF